VIKFNLITESRIKKVLSPRNTLVLIFLLCFNFKIATFAQAQYKGPNIEQTQAAISNLLAEIDIINSKSARELETLAQEPVKGEFETTAQYEARRSEYYKTLFERQEKIIQDRKAQITEVMKRLGPLFQIEFNKPFVSYLGRYDADSQEFPLYQEGGNLIGNLYVPLAEAATLKDRYADASSSITSSLYVDFSDQIRTMPLGAQVNFGGRIYKTVAQAMSADKAMKLLYGSYNSVTKRATVEFHRAELMEGTFDDNELVFATPFFQQAYTEGDKEKFIILTGATPENHDCHACSPLVGAAIFARSGSGWKVQVAQRSIGRYFSWGKTGDPKMEKIGGNRQAVAFEWGDGNQGFFGGNFYFLAEIDYSIREVARFESFEDNSGAIGSLIGKGEYINIRGKYELIPRLGAEFFDIKVIYKGRKGTGKGRAAVIKPYAKVVWYKFIRDKYVEYNQ
jgi:hypothetical protein